MQPKGYAFGSHTNALKQTLASVWHWSAKAARQMQYCLSRQCPGCQKCAFIQKVKRNFTMVNQQATSCRWLYREAWMSFKSLLIGLPWIAHSKWLDWVAASAHSKVTIGIMKARYYWHLKKIVVGYHSYNVWNAAAVNHLQGPNSSPVPCCFCCGKIIECSA